MPTSVTPKAVRETQRWMRGSSERPLPPSESAGGGDHRQRARRAAWRGPPSTCATPAGTCLITAAIRAAIGREPIHTSGDLERDLRRTGEQARAIFASRPFQRMLPRLIEGLLQPRSSPTAITYDVLAPNRRLLADEYRSWHRQPDSGPMSIRSRCSIWSSDRS